MGAKVPLMVAQANEANTATDETPAKAAPLRALRLAFLVYRLTSSVCPFKNQVFRTPKIRDSLIDIRSNFLV
jgi:hypothetical protein